MNSCLQTSYRLLQNSALYETNVSKFKQDALFKQTSKASDYVAFLDDLANNCDSKLQKLYQMVKRSIVENVVVVGSKLVPGVYYTYSNSNVFCHLNTSDSADIQMRQIIGGVFVYNITNSKLNAKTFVLPFANIFSNIISRSNIRPVDYNEVYPYIARTTIYWFLKNNKLLTDKNFTAAIEHENVSFINNQEKTEFLESLRNITSVDDYLTTISNYLKVNPSNLLVWLNNKLSLQFTLGLECIYHSIYMLYISQVLKYPSPLFYALQRFKVSDQIVKTLKPIAIKKVT